MYTFCGVNRFRGASKQSIENYAFTFFPGYILKILHLCIFILCKYAHMMMIATKSRALIGGKERGEVKEVWRNLRGRGGKCRLRGNGATQSATCCIMCKKGWVGIGHERFENSGSTLGGIPQSLQLNRLYQYQDPMKKNCTKN